MAKRKTKNPSFPELRNHVTSCSVFDGDPCTCIQGRRGRVNDTPVLSAEPESRGGMTIGLSRGLKPKSLNLKPRTSDLSACKAICWKPLTTSASTQSRTGTLQLASSRLRFCAFAKQPTRVLRMTSRRKSWLDQLGLEFDSR